ncbi:MAG TPA: hypothetical protein VFA12_16170 [Stellaceae bacterium]|nr:hypothetical protein [Stellaceae bacterium]
MHDLDRALADIVAIRTQIARGTAFRGYGPLTLAATGIVALLTAEVQALWLDDPLARPLAFFGLWMIAAVVALGLLAVEAVTRSRRLHSSLADAMIYAAMEQFVPAAAAGALLGWVLAQFAPQSLWLLPGLWQIIVSLGAFAACRGLPRTISLAGVWYLAAGLVELVLASQDHSVSPWAMGVPFGVGQLLIALLLHLTLGGRDAEI